MRLQDCGAFYDEKFEAKLPQAGWRIDKGYARRIWRDPVTGKLRTISMHRIIWELEYGTPPPMLDHINGNRLDNRLGNLRPATPLLNSCNLHHSLRGCWVNKNGRFETSIDYDNKTYHLGTFDSEEKAKAAYDKNYQIRLVHLEIGLPGVPPFDFSNKRRRGRPRKSVPN